MAEIVGNTREAWANKRTNPNPRQLNTNNGTDPTPTEVDSPPFRDTCFVV